MVNVGTGPSVNRLVVISCAICTSGILVEDMREVPLQRAQVLSFVVPGMPVYTPLRYMLAALVVSALTGLLSGVVPARRAASLRPVEALRAE